MLKKRINVTIYFDIKIILYLFLKGRLNYRLKQQ